MSFSNRFIISGVFLFCFLFLCGCRQGPQYPHVTVSGTVTLDGKPLEEGSIIVMSQQGNVGANLGPKGDFLLKHVPKGKIRFFIHATQETGKTQKGALGTETPIEINLIPKEYAEGIEKEIEESVKDMKIELVSQ